MLYLQVLKTFSKTSCQSRAENELTFFTFRDLYITLVQSKKNVIIFTLNSIMLVLAVTHVQSEVVKKKQPCNRTGIDLSLLHH